MKVIARVRTARAPCRPIRCLVAPLKKYCQAGRLGCAITIRFFRCWVKARVNRISGLIEPLSTEGKSESSKLVRFVVESLEG